MASENDQLVKQKAEERRLQKGTRLWVQFNIILFPIPSHFSLLRVREFSLAQSFLHLGITFSLLLILISSAILQIVFPGIGRLWMLLPIFSGFIIILRYQSSIARFQPFDISIILKKHIFSILSLFFFFTILNILPELDLIEFQDKSTTLSADWIEKIPIWQSMVIFMLGILTIFIGYASNSPSKFSINRIIILYGSFILLSSQIYFGLMFAYRWLNAMGGLGSEFLIIMLSAILVLDYWDAESFGQFTRRYFLLTCTKGFSFLFLWFCFMGLPQRLATTYSSYYYERIKPAPWEISYHNLIFTAHNRFKSGHTAVRKARALYSKALLTDNQIMTQKISNVIKEKNKSICPAGNDICQLRNLVDQEQYKTGSFTGKDIPFFRPVHPAWDVFLTALIQQGTITESEIDKTIAGFKTRLPKSSGGYLPNINTTYDSHYVSSATKTHVRFISPLFENIVRVLEKRYTPLLQIYLSGNTYWSALLCIDQVSQIAWFRIETSNETEKSIQTLFDANESQEYKKDILAYQIIALPIAYFRSLISQNSDPIIIFGNKDLNDILSNQFDRKTLENNKKVFSHIRHAQKMSADTITLKSDYTNHSSYAGYIHAVARLKRLAEPRELSSNLFPDPKRFNSNESWPNRFQQMTAILQKTAPLRDRDRIHIASMIVANNNVHTDPALFIRLSKKQLASNDLISCQEAFQIGRQLFLLGYYTEGLYYLEISFARHPFSSEYELWYHLALQKLKRKTPEFYSPPNQQPGLWLYMQTISDIDKGNSKVAFKRLEKAIEQDSHDCMANHLLHKYFQFPLNEKYFFPVQEGF